jgi:UDP-N-acetylglucosamine 4,6-dehydratase/5-epimerase
MTPWALVTGGTGTVGTELVRTLLKQERHVRVFSRDEGRLAEMRESLNSLAANARFLVGDVRDRDRLMRAMEGVEEVYHAAALKHVDSCEYNPSETIKTNILGVQNIAECAAQSGVQAVVNMSSDKAAAPHNLMGATKLVGERLTAYANSYGRGCRFMSVRFGNILGSRGSVIPLWREQLRQGFIRVTDPRMTRYVMPVSQAVSLCQLAAKNGLGGEVFVLQMPVFQLGNLAKVVIAAYERRHGMDPGHVDMAIVGARPGETLDETIVTEEEAPRTAEKHGCYAILPNIVFASRDYEKAYGPMRLSKELNSSGEKILDVDETRRLMAVWGI